MNAAVAPEASQTIAALDLLRAKIIDLTLPPGSRIDESLLLDHFRLGRTPAREAINRLVAEGFVNIAPNRGGTFVRKLDLEDMGQIVVAHQLAENIAGQLSDLDDPTLASDLDALQRSRYVDAVKRRDYLEITEINEAFHLRLHRSIGNSFLFDFAQSTHRHVRRLNVYIYQVESRKSWEESQAEFATNLEEHERIIAFVIAKDRAGLAHLLNWHARSTHRRLMRILEAKQVVPFALDLAPFNGLTPSNNVASLQATPPRP